MAKSNDYRIGDIRIPGIEPTKEWKEYVALEKEGKATAKDARRLLHTDYQMKNDGKILVE